MVTGTLTNRITALVEEPEIRVVGGHICEMDFNPLDIDTDRLNFPVMICVPHEDNEDLVVENLITLHEQPERPTGWVRRSTSTGVRMRDPRSGALSNVSLTFTLGNQIHAESTSLRL